MSLTIRPVTTLAECEHVNAITMAAWGAGPETTVPTHLLITLVRNNGVVLLAWDGDDPIGFCLGFPTFSGDRVDVAMTQLQHCSHMAAVLPDYQGRGVGAQLKWAQADAVAGQGIGLVTWTYDPLESMNAHLNLRKLGAVCDTYRRNVYGELTDALNRGLATDRFEVAWWVRSAHVDLRRTGRVADRSLADWLADGARFANGVQVVDSLLRPSNVDLFLAGVSAETPLLVAIPLDFQQIKRDAPALAQTWRSHTRALFERLFAAGYTAIDFARGETYGAYVLRRDWMPADP